jgi:flagellar protein FlaG
MAISPVQRDIYVSNVESTTQKMDSQKSISEENMAKTEQEKQNEQKLIEKEEMTNEEVQQSVKKMNQIFNTLNQKLSFEIFEDENDRSKDELYVALIDKETEKVVKEIPPKEILEMRARIKEYVGMLIDKRI